MKENTSHKNESKFTAVTSGVFKRNTKGKDKSSEQHKTKTPKQHESKLLHKHRILAETRNKYLIRERW